MKIFLVLLLCLPLSSFACWRMKGQFHVGQEEFKIDQKIKHDQTYSFHKGPYILHVKVPESKEEGKHTISIEVWEKIGTDLKKQSDARVIVEEGKSAEMTSSNQSGLETSLKIKLEKI